MLYAHGRAKEHRVVRGPWPARITPLENETLSSWLVRASLANFSSPSEVANYIWPGWRAWTRDIDRGLTSERLRALQQVSGLTEQTLKNIFLRPLIESLTCESQLHETAPWPWVIQRSTRNKNTTRSTQFCPLCFREDVKPYLKRQWRLSFVTVCTEHNVNLYDNCPHCGASVEIHKITRGKLKSCVHCRWDVSDTQPTLSNNNLLKVTQSLQQHAFNNQPNSADNFIRLRYLISLVRRLATQTTIPKSALSLLKSDEKQLYALNDFSSLAFDWLCIDDRRSLMQIVSHLMPMTSCQLAFSLLKSGIPLSILNHCSTKIPAELEGYFPDKRQLTTRSSCATQKPTKKLPSKRAVERRWQDFLIKHGLNK